MKRGALLVLSVILVCSYLFGGTPPTAVQKTFIEKYQTATNISWEKEDNNEWEVEFKFDGTNLTANFAENGAWIDSKMEMKIADSPTAILETINSIYSGWTLSEIVKKETSKQGTVYDVDLKKRTEKLKVTFKEDGTKVAD